MKKVVVLGATSAIAQATVRLLAARGASLYLVGRNAENLDAVAKDAATRGAAKVESKAVDLTTSPCTRRWWTERSRRWAGWMAWCWRMACWETRRRRSARGRRRRRCCAPTS